MEFILNANTAVEYSGENKPVLNAVNILKRDIKKKFFPSEHEKNRIVLCERADLADEEYIIEIGAQITVYASEELGFVYGLLRISESFLEIKPFWFWMDQKIGKTDYVSLPDGQLKPKKPAVKYRGWFVNDEVLIMKWSIDGDPAEPWRMVFEALLRCGGNMVIPGTDKNSKIYRRLASEMGLWITQHHAEPLGAEMFARAYPDTEPNYTEAPGLFRELWEEAVIAQKDMKVIWALGFRGQGDCPFWSSDSSGRFDTDEKRGELISDIISLQERLVRKYVKNPVFCTNLYGEIMELYEAGHIRFNEDVIKIGADNGYGKMVTRRRDNHTVRISSLPKRREKHGGIYYHVSFYDLQAANHITMLPNSVDFVNSELDAVMEMNASDFWIINCSNVRPHVYFLDAIRKKWYGKTVSDMEHSIDFSNSYFNGNLSVAECYRGYHGAMIAYGSEEDEHAGEQFFTENVRLLIHSFFNERAEGTPGLRWLLGEPSSLDKQVEQYSGYFRENLENIRSFCRKCAHVSVELENDEKALFNSTILLHTLIHYYCTEGVILFADGYKAYREGSLFRAFMLLGDSASCFKAADANMRLSEYGVWKGFYSNDCLADIKHTAYMVEKLMGYVRERGDNARHDKWYREAVYEPEDRKVMTLLVNDNHMTDWEMYEAFTLTEYEN